ncbi:MAG TPA: 1,4-alpha-glucan branching protein GlgB [Steroidobacteraceae bacterium]|nr:1,4-alpha-glucan branching protein GlgB [Steroidobacteraceae bacterium]
MPAGFSPTPTTIDRCRLTDHDIYLFKQGTHTRLHEKMGAHSVSDAGRAGVHFAVWAPNARRVSVIGDFNDWRANHDPLAPRSDGSGIWEGFVAGVGHGATYKYRIESQGRALEKGDPFARCWEVPPRTASRVWQGEYEWRDQQWMQQRGTRNAADAPMSIYEVHLGSWRRHPENGARSLTYREMAEQLPAYVSALGFTHVEFMPLMEHPFYGSWGYQTTGYFAATSRYGTPEDLKYLVDALHGLGIGVIFDWVPSHFPGDAHGLACFDGTHLFEHQDRRQGFHPEWQSWIFNYGRHEVRAFLASSAMYWLDEFHADGLRVDAVASMLYLDYGRKDGEWIPNAHGGRENLDAVEFLRQLNEAACRDQPGTKTIAEESTAWPGVTRPTSDGGLGFGMKWNMGWMHDTLEYFKRDPVHRRFHHDELKFSLWYAFSEDFVLPLSHDEVVYGKGSLLGRMPGDEWQRFANLRLLYGYMWTHPGKKLLYMGGEFGQWSEWNHESSLDWQLLERPLHRSLSQWIGDLNRVLRQRGALHTLDFDERGFRWVDASDAGQSVLAYLRRGAGDEYVLVACNFTPVPRHNHRLGVPVEGRWREILNSDAAPYGGSGQGNLGGATTVPVAAHGFLQSIVVTLPPLAVVMFEPE